MEKLPIIFRAERSGDFKGDVTAVFPTLPHDAHGLYFTVYAHVGQHSSGGFEWYWKTRPATAEEAAPLLAELRGIYSRKGDPEAVELVVYQRMTTQHRDTFRAQVDEWRDAR